MVLASRPAERLSAAPPGRSTAGIRFTRASSTRQASIRSSLSFPRDLVEAAVHDQARADRGSAGVAPVGHESQRADRRATRATTRHRPRPEVRCAGSTRTKAGNGCSSAGRLCTTGAKVDARDRIFFPFSFGPFLGFWTAFEAGCQIGAHCIPAGGMSSQARLVDHRRAEADRHLLHADLRAAPARGRRPRCRAERANLRRARCAC